MTAAPHASHTGLALLTDLYQITMAQGYWKLGRQDEHACFHLLFRREPFAGGYAVAAGLAQVIDYVQSLRFTEQDVEYLATLTGNDGKPLLDRGFLDYLRQLEITCDIDAIPEGTAVFAQEPLVRVIGPILQCQLLETALLNLVNFPTLVATKAARITAMAKGDPVLEFGLRRAQGVDGALTASRAAYIGGCAATSNVLAGRLWGIPVRGTHAHSWVMSFDQEQEAFDAYARAMPNNCVFLVDTYDTLEGVRCAIEAGRKLRAAGHRMIGIRLDSGDLAYLSIEARRMLDEAGFNDAVVMASNDLDETLIADLKHQGATIGAWGVGTNLVTAYDQPALGGVYKLGAIRKPGDSRWTPRIKISEQPAKTTNPGVLQVRRFLGPQGFIGDMIYDTSEIGAPASEHASLIVDPADPTRGKSIPAHTAHEDLLVPIFRRGKCVYEKPSLASSRDRTHKQLANLHEGIRRHLHPHQYPVGMEQRLHLLKTEMVLKARGLTMSQR